MLIVVALVVIVTITALLRARREDVPRVFDSFVRIFGSIGWLTGGRPDADGLLRKRRR